jgi:hypothetical protein
MEVNIVFAPLQSEIRNHDQSPYKADVFFYAPGFLLFYGGFKMLKSAIL